jgi:type 1 glutamine amidotransferase
MKSALMVSSGWEEHQPKQCVDIFAPFLREQGFEVEIADTLNAYLDAEKLSRLSLIASVWTMGTITREQEQGLLKAIAGGVGVAGWHDTLGVVKSFIMFCLYTITCHNARGKQPQIDA